MNVISSVGATVRSDGNRRSLISEGDLFGRWNNLTIALYRQQDGSKVCDLLGELHQGDLFVHDSVKYRITQIRRNPKGGQRALCMPVDQRKDKGTPSAEWSN